MSGNKPEKPRMFASEFREGEPSELRCLSIEETSLCFAQFQVSLCHAGPDYEEYDCCDVWQSRRCRTV